VQTGSAMRGVNTVPWRGRLEALLAIAVVVFVVAMMVVLVWAGSTATGGVDSSTAVPARAGNAYVHDDAGTVSPGLAPGSFAVVHDDLGNTYSAAGAGSAIVHDDAGNVGR